MTVTLEIVDDETTTVERWLVADDGRVLDEVTDEDD